VHLQGGVPVWWLEVKAETDHPMRSVAYGLTPKPLLSEY